MKYIQFSILLLALQLIAATAGAQIYDWTVYDTDNSGIAYDWVNAVAESPDGEIWVGTEYGLSRFDGLTWDTFYTFNSGLPDDVIRSLIFDQAGNLWVGTFLGGLAKYDGTTWTVFNTLNSLLPDNFVRSMTLDPATGALWIGTTGGLAKYDPTLGFTDVYTNPATDIPGNNVPTIYVDDDNTIWVGTINGGLGHLDGKAWESWTIANSDLIDNTILDIDKDQDGNLWLATPAGGLIIRSAAGAFLNFGTFNSDITDNDVSQVELDSNDLGIIGLSAFGIDFFDDVDWEHIDAANSDLPDDYIQVLYQDLSGNLWVGTELGGLAKGEALGDTTVSAIAAIEILQLQLYPNPATDYVLVNPARAGGKYSLVVTSMDGRTILQENFISDGTAKATDVSGLPAGMYTLYLFDGKRLQSAIFSVADR